MANTLGGGLAGDQHAPHSTDTKATLYVGNLDPNTSEGDLFNIFSEKHRSVVSVRLCRHNLTQLSLGYGYVNYSSAKDAENAVKDLNCKEVNGRCIRVAPVERDPAKRRSNKGNIFINNLEPHMRDVNLYDTFTQYGVVLSCKAVLDRDGMCRGFGFVQFEKEDDAQRAIEDANGKDVRGKKLYVAKFKSRKEREEQREKCRLNFTNVYVKSLRPNSDENELKALFSPYGGITSAHIKTLRLGAVPSAYGFVNFQHNAEAVTAISKETGLHQHHILYMSDFPTTLGHKRLAERISELTLEKVKKYHFSTHDGKVSGFVLFTDKGEDAVTGAIARLREAFVDSADCFSTARIFAQRAQKKTERQRELRAKRLQRIRERIETGGNLYVKNFSVDVTEDTLRDLFSAYGTVHSVKVMRDREGISRTFGFVTMASADDAGHVVQNRRKIMLDGRNLYVAYHQTKSERLEERTRRSQQGSMHMLPNQQPFVINGQMYPQSFTQPPAMASNGFFVNNQPLLTARDGSLLITQPPNGGSAMAFHQPGLGYPMQQQLVNGGMRMPSAAPPQAHIQHENPNTGQLRDIARRMPTMTPAQVRSTLGDHLYHAVANLDAVRAPKITGMLLEYDYQKVINLLTDQDLLKQHVIMAQNVLESREA
jgi:polyadenylate-binding protein